MLMHSTYISTPEESLKFSTSPLKWSDVRDYASILVILFNFYHNFICMFLYFNCFMFYDMAFL